MVKVLGPFRLMNALAVSHTKSAATFVASAVPLLHTRAPTGNVSGPLPTGSLLSSPRTFHVIGSMVKAGWAPTGGVTIERSRTRVAAIGVRSRYRRLRCGAEAKKGAAAR